MFKPKTLTEIINLARMRDDQLQQEKRWNNQRHYSSATENSRPAISNASTTVPWRLTWEELKRKRSLGLCFSYDEHYYPGHKCKQPQIFLMESEQDKEGEDDVAPDDDDQPPEITLHASTGWNSSTTIRLRTSIGNHNLLALVDSGSTHNFISEKAAQRLKLKLTPTTPFSVKIANGSPLRCRRRYEEVKLQIGDANFTVALHTLPLVGLDMVLGVTWLESLGAVMCDWKAQTIQIEWEGKTHTLYGLHSPIIRPTNAQELVKEARQGQTLFAICLSDMESPLLTVAKDFRNLIQEFDELFQTLTGLPPQREIEH